MEYGPKHAKDRWDTCSGILLYEKSEMKIAVLAFYESERQKFDSLHQNLNGESNQNIDVYEEAEKFIKEAVDEAIRRFIRGNNYPLRSSLKVLKKLKNLEIVIGVTKKTLHLNELDEFYKDLKLNGSEGLYESLKQMEIFEFKLKNERKESNRTRIRQILSKTLKYHASTTNTLC